LKRLSPSRCRNNLILKGGALAAAMIGLDKRSALMFEERDMVANL
jgi:hypothetical protein